MMKPQLITTTGNSEAKPVQSSTGLRVAARRRAGAIGLLGISALLLLGSVSAVHAQDVRFLSAQVRATVPVNINTSSAFTNVLVNLINVDTNTSPPVDLSVSGLPPGATYTLTATNGDPLTSTLIDTNLVLTLFVTNVSEGVYNFSLNGSGGATNSVFFVLQ